MDNPSTFFQALFDFSFKEFVTPKIIKILYGLGIFLAAIAALGLIVRGFDNSFLKGLLILIVSPFVFIVYTILVRIWLEIVIALFRIADNVGEIAKVKKQAEKPNSLNEILSN
jgi:hypothetical protein